MHNRKILIITYYWPPSGGVGVQRWTNFSLQLQKRNWEPIVYTPENPQFEIKDEGLLEKVESIPVLNTTIWEPFSIFHKITGQKERNNVKQGLVLEKSKKTFMDRLSIWIRGNLFIPDPRIFWVGKSVRFLAAFISREEIKTVVTTGPPHSMHLIGKGLKKRCDINWIADFRDPWSQWDIVQKLSTSLLATAFHKRLEKSVVTKADIVTTVSRRSALSFENLYDRRVSILNNGVTVEVLNESDPDPQHFTMGYFGMLNELRNPAQLWQTLDQLCHENEEFNKKLRIKIGGIVSENIQEEILSFQRLKDKVGFLGYLPHKEVKEQYIKCNVLLLLLNKSNNAQWILPVKFFEYVAAKRKILALGEGDSDLGDLMNGKDLGELLDYSNVGEIRGFLLSEFENGSLPNPQDIQEVMDRFSHEKLADTLQTILESNE